jgi:hypothetical protein
MVKSGSSSAMAIDAIIRSAILRRGFRPAVITAATTDRHLGGRSLGLIHFRRIWPSRVTVNACPLSTVSMISLDLLCTGLPHVRNAIWRAAQIHG